MLDPPDVRRILALKAQGWGAKRIARELGVARGTVRRYLRAGGVAACRRAPRPGPLDAHSDWLKERFLAVGGNARVLVREILAQFGLVVAYATLARVVKPWRDELAAKARATVRFETEPGHQAQADFGVLRVSIAGVPVPVHFCVVTLGYSRRLFVRAFRAERQEHWLAGFEAAFRHFGGVPAELLLDNARALVAGRVGDVVRFTDALLAFCALHGTVPRACRPFRARTKGKVESGVKYVKRNALAGRSFDSFEELEAWLERWTRDVADVRVHGTTHERPVDRFVREISALKPLRVVEPFVPLLVRKVSSDCFIDVSTNRYSVPARFVGRMVDVRVAEGHITIRFENKEIARHARSLDRHRVVLDQAHIAELQPRRPAPLGDLPPTQDVLAPYAALAGGAS